MMQSPPFASTNPNADPTRKIIAYFILHHDLFIPHYHYKPWWNCLTSLKTPWQQQTRQNKRLTIIQNQHI